jgi:hypothetical protein
MRGRSLEVSLQEQASNQLKLLWLRVRMVSLKGKGMAEDHVR